MGNYTGVAPTNTWASSLDLVEWNSVGKSIYTALTACVTNSGGFLTTVQDTYLFGTESEVTLPALGSASPNYLTVQINDSLFGSYPLYATFKLGIGSTTTTTSYNTSRAFVAAYVGPYLTGNVVDVARSAYTYCCYHPSYTSDARFYCGWGNGYWWMAFNNGVSASTGGWAPGIFIERSRNASGAYTGDGVLLSISGSTPTINGTTYWGDSSTVYYSVLDDATGEAQIYGRGATSGSTTSHGNSIRVIPTPISNKPSSFGWTRALVTVHKDDVGNFVQFDHDWGDETATYLTFGTDKLYDGTGSYRPAFRWA